MIVRYTNILYHRQHIRNRSLLSTIRQSPGLQPSKLTAQGRAAQYFIQYRTLVEVFLPVNVRPFLRSAIWRQVFLTATTRQNTRHEIAAFMFHVSFVPVARKTVPTTFSVAL